MLKLLQVDS